ncbi:MAG: ComF family protein [bacterium]
MKKAITTFCDFLLPRFCVSCSTKLSINEHFICNLCQLQLTIVEPDFLGNEFCRKFKDDKYIDKFFSLYLFEKNGVFRSLIHSLKYKNNYRIGLFLGNKIAEYYLDNISLLKPDVIIPLPLHHVKKAQRGYNQAYYIAKGISKKIHIPVCTSLVIRIKYKETQTFYNLQQRKENIEGAFKVKKTKNIFGKTLLIVDDVITTGATINECAKVLKLAGAKNIYAVSAGLPNLE